tara:strand:+ start:1253 stop:2458 length:1206 start_codon:yes stop_codon:yes gene_type:complete
MKIKPVILCGGAGTRLWPKSKKNLPKQFINFGGWTLFQQTILRIKNPIFDNPIISTNLSYLKLVRKYLKKSGIKKYKIILEPYKKNTASAILSSVLLEEVDPEQPMLFLPADHLIEKISYINKSIVHNKKYLTENNIFVFGIKPSSPSIQYGYFMTKKISNSLNKVVKFIEKPKIDYAKKIIKKKAYWNAGMLLARKDSIINNFIKYETKTLSLCIDAVLNARLSKNVFYLKKNFFKKIKEKSFDYAILEKSKDINGIKLDIPWSDLGSWKEISKVFKNNIKKYFKKSNVFYRPWGKYTNLFNGKGFLVKELVINPKSAISLQKHHHRSEHWTIISGKPKITLNKKKFYKKVNETAFVPKGTIHRIENPFNSAVKIMEIQTGSLLKETDIVRYKDIYGRVN